MHSFKIIALNLLLGNEPSPIPKSNQCHFCFAVAADPELHFFPDGNAVDAEAQVVKGDPAIRIDDSLVAITEDIVGRLKGRLDNKGTEEVPLFFDGSCESKRRDFPGGRVNPLESVLVDLPIKNLPGLFDLCDSFPATGADQMILHPPIGSLHFSLGRRAQGIGHLDVQILQDFSPLDDGVFLFDVGLLPKGVSLLDEPEDRMIVDVIF